MTVDSPEVQRVLAGLAAKLNLPSKSDAFKVLKAAATALGCSVQKDGTTAPSACGSGCKVCSPFNSDQIFTRYCFTIYISFEAEIVLLIK